MKQLFTILAGLLLCSLTASADDRAISPTELPSAAKQFIESHFANIKITYTTTDKGLFESEYEVRLDDGTKIEFDRNGNWSEVANRHHALPVAIVPQPIADYVATNYPKAKILKIERDNRSTEVRLDNGMELTFNAAGRLTEVDD